jgi:leucyl aminopeptidase
VTLEIALDKAVPAEASVTVVGVCSDRLAGDGAAVDGAPADVDPGHLAGLGFTGKLAQTVALSPTGDGLSTFVVGLGPSVEVGPAVIRRAAAAATRGCRHHRVVAVRLLDAVADPAGRPAAAQALAEGLVLGAYRFVAYKSDPDPVALERAVVVGGGGRRVADALALGTRIAGGVAWARDLVNTPGGDLTPTRLAEAAADMAAREGLEITVLDEKAIVAAGLGGLLGVNRGSTQPPRFIQVTYSPPGAKTTLALVGKGITFDSGGLSLKTAQGMTTMKDDMGGAAAILGALSVMAAAAPRVEVRAYIPATDNMTGGDATRVGDVLRIRNGKTVEVLNTDAEGRLVLADGLSMASESSPDAIVDVATLTGAIEVALGTSVAGLFGTHDGFNAQVIEAAERSGERVWPMPLVDDYRSQLDSDVADLKNIGKPAKAGAVIAALFLREFVAADVPWVHLDIAGTAWSDADDPETGKGGTGWGVRLLVELARGFRRPSRR